MTAPLQTTANYRKMPKRNPIGLGNQIKNSNKNDSQKVHHNHNYLAFLLLFAFSALEN